MRTTSQKNGEPLFSSHMLDLSEEPIEENLDIKKQVIPEENNVKDEAYNLLLSEISNIKTLIMNLQSAYVVQNKKMEEYCKCKENKLNEQDKDFLEQRSGAARRPGAESLVSLLWTPSVWIWR